MKVARTWASATKVDRLMTRKMASKQRTPTNSREAVEDQDTMTEKIKAVITISLIRKISKADQVLKATTTRMMVVAEGSIRTVAMVVITRAIKGIKVASSKAEATTRTTTMKSVMLDSKVDFSRKIHIISETVATMVTLIRTKIKDMTTGSSITKEVVTKSNIEEVVATIKIVIRIRTIRKEASVKSTKDSNRIKATRKLPTILEEICSKKSNLKRISDKNLFKCKISLKLSSKNLKEVLTLLLQDSIISFQNLL